MPQENHINNAVDEVDALVGTKKGILISETHLNHDTGGQKWTIYLSLSASVCCFGSALPAGYNMGVMNNAAYPMAKFLNESIAQRYSAILSPGQLAIYWSSIVAIFLIGGVVGSVSGSYLADRFGRKKSLLIGNICGIIGGFCFYIIPILNAIELFWIGRFFVGLSGGLATSLVPMYMTEIAPLELRGVVGVLCQIGITSGILISQIIGLDSIWGNTHYWHYLLSAFTPYCLVALHFTLIMPESPKYLFVIKGDHNLAFKELSRLRNKEFASLQNEVNFLDQEAAVATSKESWSILQIIKSSELRLPLTLLCLIQTGQQFSGINAVFYYSVMIFNNAGLGIEGAQYATIGTGFANVLMALVATFLLSRFGRKVILIGSCFSTIICLIVLCISILLIKVHESMTLLAIVATILYVVGFGVGLGPIPYFIGSELFEVGPRSAAMALGNVCNWGSNFIVAMFFPLVQNLIGAYTFFLFVAYLLFVVYFIKKYLPETCGRTIDQVIKLLAAVNFTMKRA